MSYDSTKPELTEKCRTLSTDWAKLVRHDSSFSNEAQILESHQTKTHYFITGSSYVGNWNLLGLYGFGIYTMPHNVEYTGQLQENVFHGKGQLKYPLGHAIHGYWEKGELQSFRFTFPDGLEYTEPWEYCKMPDRRFSKTIRLGFNPPGLESLTNDEIPREIPPGCYDTGEGYYDPNRKCVMSLHTKGNTIRIVTRSEEEWILNNCRRAWDEPTGYRPDLYEKWTSGRWCESFESQCNNRKKRVKKIKVEEPTKVEYCAKQEPDIENGYNDDADDIELITPADSID